MRQQNKLLVGGLAWKVDAKALLEHFQKFGTVVDARVIMDRDRDTGKSRGFGFVTYESAEAAAEARKQLDGST